MDSLTIRLTGTIQSSNFEQWKVERINRIEATNTRLVTSDDHQGLKAALRAVLPGVPWQRCQTHMQRNATAHVPRADMRETVAAAIRAVFNAPDLHEAERLLAKAVESYQESAPGSPPGWRTTSPRGSRSSRSRPTSAVASAPRTSWSVSIAS